MTVQDSPIGKIPVDWELKTVDEIKDCRKHAMAMGPFGSNIKTDNYVPSGIPIIRGINLNYYKYPAGDFVFISEKKANDLYSSICIADDLIFTHRGTIGQVGLIPHNGYHKYIVSQSGMKLSVNKELILPLFVFYYFKSTTGKNQLLQYESQVGVPAISNPLSSLKKVVLPVPPLPEQRAIASVLSSLDDKINLLHRQNATLEAMAEALFKQWFVVEAKEEWEIISLGELCDCITDKFDPKLNNNITKYIGLEHIDRKKIYISRYGNSNDIKSIKFKFKTNDILFGKLRPYFHKICFANFDGVCSTDILVLRPKSKNLFLYSLFALYQKEIVDFATYSSSGTRMPRVDWNTLKSFELYMPDITTLKAFNHIYGPLINRITTNQLQISTLENLRNTLLPKLMSGEVRVKF